MVAELVESGRSGLLKYQCLSLQLTHSPTHFCSYCSPCCNEAKTKSLDSFQIDHFVVDFAFHQQPFDSFGSQWLLDVGFQNNNGTDFGMGLQTKSM